MTTIDLKAADPINICLVPCSQGQAQSKVLRLLTILRDTSPFDAVWDTQVLVAVNKKSPLSRCALNQKIQDLLNPAPPDSKTPFRVNDKVVQTEREQAVLAFQRKSFKTGEMEWAGLLNTNKAMIYKGEFGRVLAAEEKRTIVRFANPERTVIVYRGNEKKKDGEDEDDKEEEENDKKDAGTGCQLDLGYAATTHRMQGSQAKVIIYCLDQYPGASGSHGVCDRSHLYTGISRASACCFLVGMKHVADAICGKQFIWRRKTFFVEILRDLAARSGVSLAINEEGLW